MVNYANARVYRVVSDLTDQVYIGSTCRTLSQRMSEHISSYKRFLAGEHDNRVTVFDIIVHGDAKIYLVEAYPCDNIEQLRACERAHIERTPNCVNRNMPGRTKAEYHQDNLGVITAYQKAYQKARRADPHALERQIVVCECGVNSTYTGIYKHRKTKKHLDALAQLAGQADAEPVAQSELDPAA